MKWRIVLLSLFFVMAMYVQNAYAAFPVKTVTIERKSDLPHIVYKSIGGLSFKKDDRAKDETHERVYGTADHSKRSWPAITSFACSLATILAVFIFPPACIVLSLAAIVFGAMGLGRKKNRLRGLAAAGLGLGILELLLGVTIIIIIAILKSVVASITVI